MRRWVLGLAGALVGLAALAWLSAWWVSEPLPQGEQGPAADALARALQQAVDLPAWRETAAVHWVFMGRHTHTWDRTRDLVRVQWDETEVVMDVGGEAGCAFRQGQRQTGEALRDLLDEAYARFINDSFWLNPLGKLFDPGVERRLVEWRGEQALLVTFTQGGLTPGDSYLWLRGESGRPRAWRMWTHLPLDGLKASWEDWVQVSTGAWIATRHAVGPFDVDITDLSVGDQPGALEGVQGDPFARCPAL